MHTPFLYVSSGRYGAPFALHVEDHYLYSFNYLYRGASKFWVVVAPALAPRLEYHLKRAILERWSAAWKADMGCAQFIRHAVLWVSLGVLEAWGVAYSVVEQQAGDLMVTAPGAYHQGWNAGANIAEATNWGDALTQHRLVGYRACRPGCNPSNVGARSSTIVTLRWPPARAVAASAPAEQQAAATSYFTTMPQQPREKPWAVHDVLGSEPSPRMLENLFEDGRDRDPALVWPNPARHLRPLLSRKGG